MEVIMRIRLILFVLFCIFLTSCTNIVRSEKRDSVPKSIQIAPNIILTSTGAINIDVTFLVNHVDFFPSSFKIETQGKVIYIDPVVIDELLPADYIFITHAHDDHFSLSDINKILKKETLIICPKEVAKNLSGFRIKKVKPGDILNLGSVKFEAVAAYNIKSGFLGLTSHSKSDMNVGYILTINGVRIYHAGDTDFIPEMKELKDIAVAMVPIGGDNLTMDTKLATKLINTIKPLIAIPMHYKIGTRNTETFMQLVKTETKVVIMEQQK
jgi:L-ascorbate metabolism protein UlaG (beta-lactamase superfamily)